MTCISDAVDLHTDIPKKNILMKSNDGFVETCVLVGMDFLSSFDKSALPLGRGGGGPGVYVTALIGHSDSFKKKVSGGMDYKSFCRDHGIKLRMSEFFDVVADPCHQDRNNVRLLKAITEYNKKLLDAT